MRQSRAIFLSLLAVASATAQTGFSFGVQVGSAYTTAEISYSIVGTNFDLEGQAGLIALGVAEWSASDRLGVVAEAGYARRATRGGESPRSVAILSADVRGARPGSTSLQRRHW